MKQQILRGARLGNCVVQDDDVRIEIRCDFTESIQDEMNWDSPNEKCKLQTYDDELGAGSLKITADQKALEGGTTQIAVPFESASGFRCVRCKEKGDDTYRFELRFHVCSTAAEAVESCRAYKRTVKKGLGQMKFKVGNAPPEEVAPPIAPDEPERISNVVGMMSAGKRAKGGKNKQLAAAVAAEGFSVTVTSNEPSLQAVGDVIAQSLNGGADGYEEMA